MNWKHPVTVFACFDYALIRCDFGWERVILGGSDVVADAQALSAWHERTAL